MSKFKIKTGTNLKSSYVVYCIENLINGKKYVGRTKMILSERLQSYTLKRCHNLYLKRSFIKYGFENHQISILENINNKSIKNLNEREIFWISELKSTNKKFGYNLHKGGCRDTYVTNFDYWKNPEHINKVKQSHNKNWNDPIFRENQLKTHTSKEFREKARQRALLMWKNPDFLKKVAKIKASKEYKQKMRDSIIKAYDKKGRKTKSS